MAVLVKWDLVKTLSRIFVKYFSNDNRIGVCGMTVVEVC